MPGTTTTTTSLASSNGSLAKVSAWWRQANTGGKYTTAAVFLIPGLALFTLFVVLPMIEAGYYSFFSWNG
jgi:raffinose/stachyose/melibiose transport system permease protein